MVNEKMVNSLDLALRRNKYKHLSDDEWRWFLQQVEGRERTADKLPTFAATEGWWYPVRLSCEQCSSELAARYKAEIVNGKCPNGKCLDLTGGYGVDTYFLSEVFEHTDYVEQNAELCRIAAHNFADKPITIHNTSAEEFLTKNQIVNRQSSNRQSSNRQSSNRQSEYDLIFLDPARRDSHGGKVFRLEDCTPNVVELLPTLLAHGKRLMIKLSPMLDLTQAVKELSPITNNLSPLRWDIYVVAIKNEVKELLLLSGGSGQITAIDLDKKDQAFVFTREEEQNCQMVNGKCENGKWLYEPSAAILKAGAYKLIAERFGLAKLDVNTHLYASEKWVENFPGRVWQIIQLLDRQSIVNRKSSNRQSANVLCRNYPLTPEQLKKKMHLRDGGTDFVIGCRIAGKPTLLWAERV